MQLLNRRRYMCQQTKSVLDVNPSTLSFTWNGGSETITVTSNTSWEVVT